MSELFNAIQQKNTAKALQIIESGWYYPEYINSEGNTALLLSCYYNMPDIAMALIKTGQSHPEQVNTFGKTALIVACYNNMPDIAMALIATGQSNPTYHVITTLRLVKLSNMTAVIDALENYDNYMASLQQQAQTNPYDDPNYVMTIDI